MFLKQGNKGCNGCTAALEHTLAVVYVFKNQGTREEQ